MPLDLPQPIAAFFAAENGNDPEALSLCFAADGVVQDEGRTLQGTTAIRQWMTEAKQKYQHTVEPLSVAEREGKTVVVARVTGQFPNSPLNLQHIFGLADGGIASLEIRI